MAANEWIGSDYVDGYGVWHPEHGGEKIEESDQKTAIMGAPLSGRTRREVIDKMKRQFDLSGRLYSAAELALGGAKNVEEFCEIVYSDSVVEGVRPEVVFGQAMMETGYLRFGGDVKISQYNFAGLEATGGIDGNSFADVRTGIRAQVQYLKAYASRQDLIQECVDTRFQYVRRGVSPYVQWLGIKENPAGAGWAAAADYGYTIMNNYITPMMR